MAYVPQAHTAPFPFRVLDVVLTGRTAHIGLTARPPSVTRRSLTSLEKMESVTSPIGPIRNSVAASASSC